MAQANSTVGAGGGGIFAQGWTPAKIFVATLPGEGGMNWLKQAIRTYLR